MVRSARAKFPTDSGRRQNSLHVRQEQVRASLKLSELVSLLFGSERHGWLVGRGRLCLDRLDVGIEHEFGP